MSGERGQPWRVPFVMESHVVLRYLILNIAVCAVHIPGVDNGVADAHSRLQWDRLRLLAPEAEYFRGSMPPLFMGFCNVLVRWSVAGLVQMVQDGE